MTDARDGDEAYDDELGWTEDPRVQDGLDHLQRAAREVIAASRSLLDVAEDLVDDPRSLGRLADLLGSVGDLAARSAGGTRRPPGAGDHDDEGDPPVQRIPVS